MSKQKVLKSGTVLPLINLKGKEYLEVKYRLVWFREDHPTWPIETEYVHVDDKSAFGKAIIRNEAGMIVATAHKYEDLKGFGDYREKAETGAIGRALALLGYGTQFEPEFDEGTRVVDAPVAGTNLIVADQPTAEDGNLEPLSYKITFGKFNQRSLEEVGPDQLRSYVTYLENKAAKDKKEIVGQVKEFIDRAVEYIVSFENQNEQTNWK